MNDDRFYELVADLQAELELQFSVPAERQRYPDLYEAYRALVSHIARLDRAAEEAAEDTEQE